MTRMKLPAVDRALISAVAYADVFDWPLRIQEARDRAIGHPISLAVAKTRLEKLVFTGCLHLRDGYIFFPGKDSIIRRRRTRMIQSGRKMELAVRVAHVLSRIPTVMAVFVTGGVAAGNSDSRDDVDLLIVANEKTVWMTRLATTILTERFFTRRHPQMPERPDAICLNMFMSDRALQVPARERDVYCAHELLLAEPVFDRGHIAERLRSENRWTVEFLPNWSEKPVGTSLHTPGEDARMGRPVRIFFRLFEPIAYLLQLVYMKNRTTSEVIKAQYVRFHPVDAREWILPAWKKRIATATTYLTKKPADS